MRTPYVEALRERIARHEAELKPNRKAYHLRELKRCQDTLKMLEEIDAPRVHVNAVATMTQLVKRVGRPVASSANGNSGGESLFARIERIVQASPVPLGTPEVLDALRAEDWTTKSRNPLGLLNVSMSKISGIRKVGRKQIGPRTYNTWAGKAPKEKREAASR
jgi:hypothetical protein